MPRQVSQPEPAAPAASPDALPERESGRRLAWWQRGLLGVSVALVIVGLGLPVIGVGAPPPASQRATGEARGLAPGGSWAGESSAHDPTPRVLFGLGFGFLLGFVAGFAVRSFGKLSLIAAGFFALALFGLEHAGLVEVRWGMMADRYGSFASWLRSQTADVRALATGQLPTACAAAAGLVVGFRRR